MTAVLVLLAATLTQVEPPKPVAKEIAKATTLLASAAGTRACTEAFIAQQKQLIAHPEWLTLSEERKKQLGVGTPQVCIENEVAKLTVGITVEVSSIAGVCAETPPTPNDFVRVRITSGKDKGAIGCLSREDLRDPTPF